MRAVGMLLFLLLLFLMAVRLLRPTRRHGTGGRWHNGHDTPSLAAPCVVRSQPKPPWVRAELIRLKAWSPELGCRVIAEIFNRQFAERRVSVGETYVAGVLRGSKSDIAYLRRTIKHRIPRPLPRNRTWALDLTGKTDLTGQQHMLLGLLDHGTRACLELAVLPDKRSLTILKAIISAFRRYGLPTRLRVDNEICLNSRLMRGALALLGVRLQTTELHCPWQNGRIERFFGTLKQKLDTITVADGPALTLQLGAFRVWYNHVRPHQHLFGRTPAEALEQSKQGIGCPVSFRRLGRTALGLVLLALIWLRAQDAGRTTDVKAVREQHASITQRRFKTRTAMAGIEPARANSQRIGVANSRFVAMTDQKRPMTHTKSCADSARTGQQPKAAKRGPVGKLQQQIERINQLPRTRQQFVMEVIESVLAQSSR